MVGLRLGRGAHGRPRIGDVAVRGVDPVAAEEAPHPLPDAIRLQLVGEDGGNSHRQPLGDVEDGKMRPSKGIEEPLLAERVGPEPFHVGQMRVQDYGEVADGAVGHRQEWQIATRSRALI